MSPPDPGSWLDRVIGWSFGLLLVAAILYGAVKLLEAVLPTLLLILGGAGIAAGVVMAVRWWRMRL